MRTIYVLALIVTGMFCIQACDEATLGPELRGSIEGRVLESESLAPIPGANIVTSPPTNALVTDAEGKFSLLEIDAGNYTVTAKKPGYLSSSVTVSVSHSRATEANVLLDIEEEEGSGTIDVSVINWANRVVSADSIFVDVEFRVRNAGTKDINAYEVYFQIDTDSVPFLYEAKGDSLWVSQTDISSFSKYLRSSRANQVTVSGLWFN